MKFRISLIALVSLLVFIIFGCEDDNLNEYSYSKTTNIDFIIKSSNSEIISDGTDIIRKSGGITYDHDIKLNYKLKDLSASKVKVFNPNDPSEYMIIELVKDKVDHGEFKIDLSNGMSKIYTIDLVGNSSIPKGGGRNRLIKKIIDAVDDLFEDSGGGSNGGVANCAQQAVNACGEGNVSSVSYESGWFSSSCSFTCC